MVYTCSEPLERHRPPTYGEERAKNKRQKKTRLAFARRARVKLEREEEDSQCGHGDAEEHRVKQVWHPALFFFALEVARCLALADLARVSVDLVLPICDGCACFFSHGLFLV